MAQKPFQRKITAGAIKTAIRTKPSEQSKLDLADQVTGAPRLIGGQPSQIDLKYLRPDSHQARWLLPPNIRAEFINGKIDALEAMRQWRSYVASLKSKTEDRLAQEEVSRLNEVRLLAGSIRSGGQVNPITAVREGDYWQIETGERRFWAHVHLVVEGDAEAVVIPVIPRETLDVFRQTVENRHSSSLNAVAIARSIARLLMATSGISDPGQKLTTFADYRKALRDHRIPKEVTDRIIEAMHVSDDLIGNYRRLFDLPDEVLAIADRANLPEKLLRYVRDVKDSKWQVRIVRQAAELGLSAEKVNWWTQQADLAQAERVLRGKKSAQSPSSKSPINAPREWARQLEKLTSPELLQVSRKDIQTIATEYAKHGDAKRIRKTIQALEKIATEVEQQRRKQ